MPQASGPIDDCESGSSEKPNPNVNTFTEGNAPLGPPHKNNEDELSSKLGVFCVVLLLVILFLLQMMVCGNISMIDRSRAGAVF